jgi:hypothetical protein
MAGPDDYLQRIRSAVQSDLSRDGAAQFALTLVRQIHSDAGVPQRARDVMVDVTARLRHESRDAVDVGRPDWSDAYDRIANVLSKR